MSANNGYKPWFVDDPRLFSEQERILKAAGFELDKEFLNTERRVRFIGHSKADPGRKLIVDFPEAFPSSPPEIHDEPPSRILPRHQRIDDRKFCLFGFGQNRWYAERSVADALKEVDDLISQYKDGRNGTQNEPPEPITRTLRYAPESAFLLPPPISTFDGFPQLERATGSFSGKFNIEFKDKNIMLGRGIILSAFFGEEKFECAPDFSKFYGSHGKELQGDWFYLKEPPTPENFKNILQDCARRVKGSKKAAIYWFALIFKEETATVGKSRTTWLLARAHANPPELHLLRTFPYFQQDRYARIPGLEGLENKRVTLVGCGGLGSKIAAQLAASGIYRFNLVDFDHFEPNNSVRHELGVEWFGVSKAKALLSRLCSLNPAAVTNAKGMAYRVGAISPIANDQQFSDWVKESDLVIDATALHSASHFLNRLSIQHGVPVLYASVTGGAWGGEIVRSVPGKTACWVCWLEQYWENGPPSAPISSGQIFAPGCDQPTFTGTTYDVGFVANLATSMAVETLLSNREHGEFTNNYIRWSGKDKNGNACFSAEYLPTNRQQECPYCGSRYGI